MLFGQITIKIFAFIGENNFLVNIDKKSCRGCVKSEHVLWTNNTNINKLALIGTNAPISATLVHPPNVISRNLKITDYSLIISIII